MTYDVEELAVSAGFNSTTLQAIAEISLQGISLSPQRLSIGTLGLGTRLGVGVSGDGSGPRLLSQKLE
jgi:hypothetical protein